MKLSSQLCTLALCSLLWSISAETSPKPAYFAAYVTVEEKTLYIQGGSNTSTTNIAYDQFYSLDLTQSWNTSNPPWSELPTVSPVPAKLKTWGHSISLSRNQKTLTFWNLNDTISYAVSFHLDTNSWEELPALPWLTERSGDYGLHTAVTDPRTDQVYIPGGAGKGMLVYSPISKSSTVLEMERSAKNDTFWSAYSFVWSDARQSFLYSGGADDLKAYSLGAESSYFYEYRPGSLSPWPTLGSSGTVPPPLVGSCMVPAYNGAKMLVFGGYGVQVGIDTMYIPDAVYVLDVPTMTWSLGGKYQPRMGMVCSVSGDYFIVWGGMGLSQPRRSSVPVDGTPIIYNIKTAQWTTQFIATDNSNKNAAIIGGSGGAVDIDEEPLEKAYSRDFQPRSARAITPPPTFQRSQPVRITSPNTSHSNSPQYVYAQGPQQVSMDPPSWPTSTSPSQRVRSVSSSRSTSTLVATPTIPASPRYPSYQQQHRSPQQQQSFNLSPPARRITRNPQGRNTPEPTSDSNHKIQYQINALHAEASRLQAMLDS
ncbi:hypothetical protein K457DRAFT_26092 [Linnemannia elongata AG-77]|uniref:Galactose oxidase n=1 Tax=Linnemannia elongata AG-77 TaxID=1314771 RepID=A0A197JBC8_9FUNG|nr:hypothetical protein K457DRAFT_26092 [Linnemannia elongata AG-77]